MKNIRRKWKKALRIYTIYRVELKQMNSIHGVHGSYWQLNLWCLNNDVKIIPIMINIHVFMFIKKSNIEWRMSYFVVFIMNETLHHLLISVHLQTQFTEYASIQFDFIQIILRTNMKLDDQSNKMPMFFHKCNHFLIHDFLRIVIINALYRSIQTLIISLFVKKRRRKRRIQLTRKNHSMCNLILIMQSQ
jgi:hypothetical protein